MTFPALVCIDGSNLKRQGSGLVLCRGGDMAWSSRNAELKKTGGSGQLLACQHMGLAQIDEILYLPLPRRRGGVLGFFSSFYERGTPVHSHPLADPLGSKDWRFGVVVGGRATRVLLRVFEVLPLWLLLPVCVCSRQREREKERATEAFFLAGG